MIKLQKYDCHCHMDNDMNSPEFYLASDVDAEIERLQRMLQIKEGRIAGLMRDLYGVERAADQPTGATDGTG